MWPLTDATAATSGGSLHNSFKEHLTNISASVYKKWLVINLMDFKILHWLTLCIKLYASLTNAICIFLTVLSHFLRFVPKKIAHDFVTNTTG